MYKAKMSYGESHAILMSVLSFFFLSLPKFTLDFLGLILFCTSMAPGFCRYVYYYVFVSGRICQAYGEESCRQTVDVYMPTTSTSTEKRPVVVYVPGGGWLIGYKMWGALLARILTGLGFVVVCIDHRNYPLATVPQQVQDVENALRWIQEHIADYGGNVEQMILVGESAGGHISFMALWKQCMGDHTKMVKDKTVTTSTLPSFLGLITVASPFDLSAVQPSFYRHGMSREMTDAVFGNERDSYDPYYQVVMTQLLSSNDPTTFQQANLLPPMILCQGLLDHTVPHDSTKNFVELLQNLLLTLQKQDVEEENHDPIEKRVEFRSFTTWRHTDACLDALMEGQLTFPQIIVQACVEWTKNRQQEHPTDDDDSWTLSADIQDWPEYLSRPLCPPALIGLARFCMPIY